MMTLGWHLTFLQQGQICIPLHLNGETIEKYLKKTNGWICSNGSAQLNKMATMPIYDLKKKTLKNLLQNQESFEAEFWQQGHKVYRVNSYYEPRMPPWSLTSQLQSFAMANCPLTGSRVSLSASTRIRGMHWKGETTAVSNWQRRSWKSWRGLWTASSDSWCQSTIPSLASSKAEAQQTQSLLPGSCKSSI